VPAGRGSRGTALAKKVGRNRGSLVVTSVLFHLRH
jgi:hypothetical protein